MRKNLRRYNRKKPAAERITGSIKQLLLDPNMAKILITDAEQPKEIKEEAKTAKKEKKHKRIPIITETPADEAQILHSLYEAPKKEVIKLEKTKEIELKIDSATPMASLNIMTPLGTTTSVLNGDKVFNFPEDSTIYYT